MPISLGQALKHVPALLLKGRYTIHFDRIPLPLEHLGWRKRCNLLLLGLESALRRTKLLSRPPVLQIEPCNYCNLRCPLCPSGNGTMKRSSGMMTLETFESVLRQTGETLLLAVLYSWGEPFLNPHLPKMIRTCSERGISTVTSTNGHTIQTLADALALVDAGLKGLVIALDGTSQTIYEAYRQSGQLEKVKRCAAVVEEAKALRGSRFPYTNLRMVISECNKDQIAEVEALAQEFAVNMVSFREIGCLNESDDFSRFVTPEVNQKQLTAGGKQFYRCTFPFRHPTIFWDGTIVGCEHDYNLEAVWGRLADGFEAAWNSAAAQLLRRSVLQLKAEPSVFCRRCPFAGRKKQSFVSQHKELRSI